MGEDARRQGHRPQPTAEPGVSQGVCRLTGTADSAGLGCPYPVFPGKALSSSLPLDYPDKSDFASLNPEASLTVYVSHVTYDGALGHMA